MEQPFFAQDRPGLRKIGNATDFCRRRNVDYYDRRSSHGSTLSRMVHASVLARSDRQRAIKYYVEALQSDVSDIQQGRTVEGVHLGAMAGTVDLVQRVFTGIEITGDVLRFNPHLPEALRRLDMRIRYRGHTIDLELTREALTLRCRQSDAAPITVQVRDETRRIEAGTAHVLRLARKARTVTGATSAKHEERT